MTNQRITLLLSFLLFSIVSAKAQERYPFEHEIVAFKEKDSISAPPKGGILFVGSSSIRLWDDLEQRFSGYPIIKRGVGGCQLAHIVEFYLDEIVLPYDADHVFVYAGENDIVNGASAKHVVENFKTFWTLLRRRNPAVKIYYLTIKTSSSKLEFAQGFQDANAGIAAFIAEQEGGAYIDVASVLLGEDGLPDDTLFIEDKLHLGTAGYDRWEAVIRPYLPK